MNDVLWKDGSEPMEAWSIVPRWNLPWRRRRRLIAVDDLPRSLEYDIGLTDLRPAAGGERFSRDRRA